MKNLANLVDAWVDDYSIQEFLDAFTDGQSFGEIVEQMYENGLISEEVIEAFLED